MSASTARALMLSWADTTLRTTCRVCDAPLTPYLDLGVQPLANAFLHREDLDLPEFTAPLHIAVCLTCGLSQLTHVVAPERLYTKYLFTAGMSDAWRTHCQQLAHDYTLQHGDSFVVEIAANDGTLLNEFHACGHRVLGIEPAENIAHPDLPWLRAYWDSATATKVVLTNGQADVIVATNVLGHVDHVIDFLEGIRIALRRHGIAIIECPHILPLLECNAFDTIYHEHLSYWSLGPLQRACTSAGLAVVDCMPQDVHGGTMRYVLAHREQATINDNVVGLWKREAAMDLKTIKPYERFAAAVRDLKHRLQKAFERRGLYGFGASAKGNTLLNYIGATLPAIFDESPFKQGLLTPGRHIPVRPLPASLESDEVEALVLLSWNCAREMKAKAHARGFRGEYLVPIPRPQWSMT